MAVSKILFSSNSDEWATPDELFSELDREFNFTLDVCATSENTKCEKFFDINIDGLSQNWGGARVL